MVSIYNFLEGKMFGQTAMIGVFQFYSCDSILWSLVRIKKKKKKKKRFGVVKLEVSKE